MIAVVPCYRATQNRVDSRKDIWQITPDESSSFCELCCSSVQPQMRNLSVFVNYRDLISLTAVLMGQGDSRKEAMFKKDGFAYDINRFLVRSIATFVHRNDHFNHL